MMKKVMKDIFLKLMFSILKNYRSFTMKIEKVKRFVANLLDETEYTMHIENSKQALNNGLVLKKVHRVIKFNQNAWLKPFIDMNTI